MEGEAPGWGRGVDSIRGRNEVDSSGSEVLQSDNKVPNASGEAVEPPDRHHVDLASADLAHHAVEFGSPILGSRVAYIHEFTNDLPSPLLGKPP